MAKVILCPYCEAPAVLVSGDVIYPYRSDLRAKRFWLCQPCDAYVGCHAAPQGDGTVPLGRLANAELRQAKIAAHAAFDPLWHQARPKRPMKRKAAYTWLAEQLGIPRKQCHIGKFDVEQCKRVVELCVVSNEEV